MKVIETGLSGVLLVEPDVYADARGHFLETFRAERYAAHGIAADFAQDSLSFSRKGVLRGLHLQWPRAQGKLVYVLAGEVWDVAVDVRRGSPTYGRWEGHVLSEENRRQLWIPEGLLHGFVVTGESALFAYKCTAPYDPESELAVRWDDPDLAIEWPVKTPLLSEKDAAAPNLSDLDKTRLPTLGT